MDARVGAGHVLRADQVRLVPVRLPHHLRAHFWLWISGMQCCLYRRLVAVRLLHHLRARQV